MIKEYQKKGKSWSWFKANIIQVPVPEEYIDMIKKRSGLLMCRIKHKEKATLIIIQDFINGKRQQFKDRDADDDKQ